jgi:endo-1,4-beta-xylanase
MKYFARSSALYLLLGLAPACGADGAAQPAVPPFDGESVSPAATGSGAAPSGGGSNEGQDTNIGLEGNGGRAGAGLPEPLTLREAAALAGRLIGTAMPANRLNNAAYTAAAREFNYVTPENEMKWNAVEAQPGQFNFNNANRIVDFAEANGMKIKGHTLVWHSQLPNWVKQLTTREEVLAAMERHITTVVSQYKGRVHAWDVVNEAFVDGNARLRGSNAADAADPANSGANGPDSIFRRLIGEDFIDRAFTLANAADPDALLFYNDYNTEGTGGKSNAVFDMVQGMLQRGVPIDGVGMQMHINSTVDGQRSAQQIAANVQRLTDLGLQVQISELDVSLCGNAAIDQRRREQQARLASITEVCMNNPACTAVTVWGVGDADSWRDSACNGGRSEPLLFDASYKRKDAYRGVFDALVAAAAP